MWLLVLQATLGNCPTGDVFVVSDDGGDDDGDDDDDDDDDSDGQFKRNFRTVVIPCYVASGATGNPGELPYR